MNKRHYEHTLPNIRGSLSNTYRQDRIAKTLTPACSSLLFFKEKNGISRAEPFPKKREKTMRNEMNIKNM